MVAADVGELGLMLKDKPHLLYEDGDVDSFVSVISQQLDRREVVDIEIPSWADQAELLQQLMLSALSDN